MGLRPSSLLPACGILLVLAATAHGGSVIHGQCAGAGIELSVAIYGSDDIPGAVESLVVTRQTVGLCDKPVILPVTEMPIPSDEVDTTHHTFLDERVETGVFYQYRVMGVDADGLLRYVPSQLMGLNFCYASCGSAPFSRGYIVMDLYSWVIEHVPCEDGCWTNVEYHSGFMADYSQIPESVLEDYLWSGVAVDLWTDRVEVSGDLLGSGFYVRRIDPAPEGECAPVPTRTMSWGRVKGIYR